MVQSLESSCASCSHADAHEVSLPVNCKHPHSASGAGRGHADRVFGEDAWPGAMCFIA